MHSEAGTQFFTYYIWRLGNDKKIVLQKKIWTWKWEIHPREIEFEVWKCVKEKLVVRYVVCTHPLFLLPLRFFCQMTLEAFLYHDHGNPLLGHFTGSVMYPPIAFLLLLLLLLLLLWFYCWNFSKKKRKF